MRIAHITITIVIASVAATLAGCAPLLRTGCATGEEALIHDTLYFGTGKPRGGMVTPAEWSEFLKSAVTPRFPQGLTVSPASGQWRGADGAIVQEASQVLQLIHPDDDASENAVQVLVAVYKAQFEQEAVLRVKARTCVSF
ncbi:DUF3574 domain-containing protein [Variovorax sp. RA8]|uniref:DUF3574 domain-containing protein n=1 Tax=Variovorax sp. (strain JCM 16519 / RA8) TaxID=662548 RepID=UPI000A6C46F4|nr:DUF3574 domain-containing protein [Variovorax sp. RA8]VTU18151.1 hypothetical protein RA8CHR_01667 [Variovorax sp. RA8]